MVTNIDNLKQVRNRRYLAKDFDGLRVIILEYARLYYPDKLKDLSELSMGGLLLDMAAIVGDNLSFYLDHQYGELNYETAVETVNIDRALREAGVPIYGAAPSVVPVTIYVEIPAVVAYNKTIADPTALPIIQTNSIFTSNTGIDFLLLEDIDFSAERADGTLIAEQRIGQQSPNGTIQTFILAASGICVSGKETSETISISGDFIPFRKITLSSANITDIMNVTDGYGNTYYKVNELTHDVVYKNVLNIESDNNIVKDALKIVPAPYRYVTNVDLATRKTTLTFGGGNASTLEDDIIPDPSEFAISLPYSQTFSRIAINPEKLLSTKTLGVATVDTTLTITYRFGGGLDHNVKEDRIKTAKTLNVTFPGNPSIALAGRIRGGIEVTNKIRSSGGEDAPTANELRSLIPSVKNSQERIVTREDMLARIYAMPTNFGRVFRAAVRSNPHNPLATQLFIISRTSDSQLITSPDTLKTNLVKFLNPYRMISDAVDVLDAKIINLSMVFEVVIDSTLNRAIVLQSILTKLQPIVDIKNFHIDQPIVISDFTNAIYTVSGVISVNKIKFTNMNGTVNNNVYSNSTFSVHANTHQNIIFPPPGGIFEFRYPEVDIIGRAVV